MTRRPMTDVGPFAVVPEWLLLSGVSDRAVRLFAVLARHANRDNECWPARATLAAALRTSVASVDRAVTELRSAGAVLTELRRDAAGDLTSSLYLLRYVRPDGGVITSEETPTHWCIDGVITSEETVSSPVMTEREPVERKPIERSDRVQDTRSVAPLSSGRRAPTSLVHGGELREHGTHAWCAVEAHPTTGEPAYRSGLCVPAFLHRDLVSRLATPDADAQLRAWYLTVVARFRGQTVALDAPKFWRREFEAWVMRVSFGRVQTQASSTSEEVSDDVRDLADAAGLKLNDIETWLSGARLDGNELVFTDPEAFKWARKHYAENLSQAAARRGAVGFRVVHVAPGESREATVRLAR